MLELSHPTVFYFLQKVPNGREIFRTLISSAGKSYDEGQKYHKPLQADCTPATSKGQKGKSLNVYHTAKPEPQVAGVFFSLRSGPSENSYFYKHAFFFFFYFLEACGILWIVLQSRIEPALEVWSVKHWTSKKVPIPLYKGNNWLRKYLLELCTNT